MVEQLVANQLAGVRFSLPAKRTKFAFRDGASFAKQKEQRIEAGLQIFLNTFRTSYFFHKGQKNFEKLVKIHMSPLLIIQVKQGFCEILGITLCICV